MHNPQRNTRRILWFKTSERFQSSSLYLPTQKETHQTAPLILNTEKSALLVNFIFIQNIRLVNVQSVIYPWNGITHASHLDVKVASEIDKMNKVTEAISLHFFRVSRRAVASDKQLLHLLSFLVPLLSKFSSCTLMDVP